MLHHLAHHLPSQAPLKDFIHHNTLHSLQHMPFHEAMRTATVAFGYRTYLPLAEYRAMYSRGGDMRLVGLEKHKPLSEHPLATRKLKSRTKKSAGLKSVLA